MKVLPQVDSPLLVRTDFSDETAWQALLAVVTTPAATGARANTHIVDDPAYTDLTAAQVVEQAPAGPLGDLLIVADKTAVTAPDVPLLVIYRPGTPDQEGLRVVASQLWSVENAVTAGTRAWDDIADAADDEGVFQGF
ncbi:DUF6924 domain-containing protein [Nocardia sp. alder85J]|uniref:DUF6924 domain-containing protein n=1 Tax=Nocardia sp. alder85J TaxID=2862949 RepID=UPI001CD5CBA8|nr:hypothetical protein [Nocardia sp. alder85J]MCX4092289.1 hypothetical protein [Nocardia sp. alder85J]